MVTEQPDFSSPLHILFQPFEGGAVFQAVDLLLVHVDGHVLHEKLRVRDVSGHN